MSVSDIELKRSPGTCCPDPTCDVRKDPLICESCGAICSECKRVIVTSGESVVTQCAYCKKELQVSPNKFRANTNCFCNNKCKVKFQKERNGEYQKRKREK